MATLTRRNFIELSAATSAATALQCSKPALAADTFKLNYLVGTCLYGYALLTDIVPEIGKAGASAIDIWPMVHGNQREQIEEMGKDKFIDLLKRNDVSFGCLSQYKLGPFDLNQELQFAKAVNCRTIVTNAKGPTGLKGIELKSAVEKFVEPFKPTLDAAAEVDVTIAIENHSNNIIATPDAIRWLRDLCTHPSMSFALAPYHLEQSPRLIGDLIHFLGSSLSIFYAWQHGQGAMQAQPKQTELLQLPGKGNLDFKPIVQALKEIRFTGWTEIFMHSFPRGTAVHEHPSEVTNEIIQARDYLESLLV
jgi:sugar phosphate isomerase/epimerase